MNDTRPSWLTEECPPWCVGEHTEADHPDDRVHQGHISTIPVVMREQSLGGEGLASTERATEFDIVRFRPVSAATEWLFVGDDEHRLQLSVESAARLRATLGSV